ncbi:MAG: MFS transporter [Gammaproteobacteria bacterium]|nr:MFS transporter [Gammaproteobacteria bacterium]
MISNSYEKSSNYRWFILVISFLLMMVVNGMTFGGPTVFDDLLLENLKNASGEIISRAELKLRESIMIWSAACFGFLSGTFADKFGVKPIMLFGLLIFSMIYFLFADVQTINDIYLIYFGFGPCLIFVGSLTNVILISKWFTSNRALGLGIMAAGSSIGSAFLTPFYAWLLNYMDWRSVIFFNAFTPLLMIIIVLCFLYERPANKHTSFNHGSKDVLMNGVLFKEALRSKNLWFLILMAMCIFYTMMGITTNAFLFLRDSGFDRQVASISATILFMGSLTGKVTCGFFAEKFGRKRVLICYFIGFIAGSILLTIAAGTKNPWFIWFGLGIFGTGFGGIYTLKQLLSADLFGLRSLGKITGLINLTDTIGSGLGPVMTALFFDLTGNYQTSFLIITCITCTGLIFSLFLDVDDDEIERSKSEIG